MKAELAYSGMLVKELAAKSGVPKHSIDNYLNTRGQLPSIESGVKLARALGVSAEYLVSGRDERRLDGAQKKVRDVLLVSRLAEQLDDEKRQFLIDFTRWLKLRKDPSSAQ